MISDSKCKELFVSIKLHLQGKYDFSKYNGKLGSVPKVQEKEKYQYSKLTSRLLSEKNVVLFFSVNMLIDFYLNSKVDTYIGNYCNKEKFSNYIKARDWQENYASNMYHDLKKLDTRYLLFPKENPGIIQEVLNGNVSIFTLVYLISAFEDISKEWIDKSEDTIFTQPFLIFLDKAKIFFPADREKVRMALKTLHK